MKNNVLIYISVFIFCIAFALYFKLDDAKQNNAEIKVTLDSIQWQHDSIRDELFSTQIELNRYQITLENIDSITKEKFETYLYNQTE
jgi:hypothetical protein